MKNKAYEGSKRERLIPFYIKWAGYPDECLCELVLSNISFFGIPPISQGSEYKSFNFEKFTIYVIDLNVRKPIPFLV